MVQIQEGYLNKKDIEYLDKTVTHNNMFPWYYLPEPVTKKYPCFTHILLPRYNYDTNKGLRINSSFYPSFTSIVENICSKNKIKIKRILRAALTLTWNFKGKHSKPHLDHPFEHINLIIYLNKFSKGSTFLFKETFNDTAGRKVIKEMKADKGKYIIFPGANYHAAGFPGKAGEVRIICIYTIEVAK